MPKRDDNHRSILIVSASDKFIMMTKKSLKGFVTIDTRKNISMARRCTVEKQYDIVVIDAPLPDETGVDFSLDIAEENNNTSILLVTSQDTYDDVLERVTDFGILVVAKPLYPGILDKALRFLSALQTKMRRLENKTLSVEEKMEEIRVVSRAKLLLVEKKHISEEDAHRFIGKQAMNNGVSRKRIAEKILKDLS